jgi:hypothetical protein
MNQLLGPRRPSLKAQGLLPNRHRTRKSKLQELFHLRQRRPAIITDDVFAGKTKVSQIHLRQVIADAATDIASQGFTIQTKTSDGQIGFCQLPHKIVVKDARQKFLLQSKQFSIWFNTCISFVILCLHFYRFPIESPWVMFHSSFCTATTRKVLPPIIILQRFLLLCRRCILQWTCRRAPFFDCSDCQFKSAICLSLRTWNQVASIHNNVHRFPNLFDRFSNTLWVDGVILDVSRVLQLFHRACYARKCLQGYATQS